MTTETDEPPLLRVRGPLDLVEAIPYLLGFHPLQSLVLVGLQRARVVVTARMDLVDLAMPGVLAQSLAAMHRGGAQDFVGVVFDHDAMSDPRAVETATLPWAGAARELTDFVTEVGGEVDEVVLVSQGRLWSYSCTEPACCPPEGRPLGGSSVIAAAATYAGLVALPDRDSVAAQLAPCPDVERDRLAPLLAAAEARAVELLLRGDEARENRSVTRALFAACRAADVPGAEPALTDAILVRFAVALRGHAVRDSLWMAVDEGRIDGRVLLRMLARRLPAPYDAPALFVFGWCTYRHGDGALAGMAADQALVSDPDYSAADLLLAALSQGLDPRRLPKLRSRRSA